MCLKVIILFQLIVHLSSTASGHLGTFTLSLHWLNLGNQPVEILIEDVYLLVVPSPPTNVDPEEEANRAQEAKAERLENAELLHIRGQAGTMLLASKILKCLTTHRGLATKQRLIGLTDCKSHQ
jgi:N-terminal region of Chorein or VPS13